MSELERFFIWAIVHCVCIIGGFSVLYYGIIKNINDDRHCFEPEPNQNFNNNEFKITTTTYYKDEELNDYIENCKRYGIKFDIDSYNDSLIRTLTNEFINFAKTINIDSSVFFGKNFKQTTNAIITWANNNKFKKDSVDSSFYDKFKYIFDEIDNYEENKSQYLKQKDINNAEIINKDCIKEKINIANSIFFVKKF